MANLNNSFPTPYWGYDLEPFKETLEDPATYCFRPRTGDMI